MRDFLTGMLQKNAKQRLGYSEEDWSQVKAHRFFRDINFDLLLAKKIRPAFIPNVVSFAVKFQNLLANDEKSRTDI